MQTAVLLPPTLARHILADRRLAPVAPHRVDVVATRPERPAPQLGLDRRHPQEHLAGRDALDCPHNFGRAVGRDRLEQKVNMVAVRPDLKERDLVAVADVEADLPQRPLDLVREHRTAVLGRADQVVKQGRDVRAETSWLLWMCSLMPHIIPNKGAKQASGNDTRLDSTCYMASSVRKRSEAQLQIGFSNISELAPSEHHQI